jgi:hypothetical protein
VLSGPEVWTNDDARRVPPQSRNRARIRPTTAPVSRDILSCALLEGSAAITQPSGMKCKLKRDSVLNAFRPQSVSAYRHVLHAVMNALLPFHELNDMMATRDNSSSGLLRRGPTSRHEPLAMTLKKSFCMSCSHRRESPSGNVSESLTCAKLDESLASLLANCQ